VSSPGTNPVAGSSGNRDNRAVVRFGCWLTAFGVGFLILDLTGTHPTALSWVDDQQPGLGVVCTLLGLTVIAADLVADRFDDDQH
jgi:hypothetical protein